MCDLPVTAGAVRFTMVDAGAPASSTRTLTLHTYTHTHIHTYTHTHIHTYTHKHTHIVAHILFSAQRSETWSSHRVRSSIDAT